MDKMNMQTADLTECNIEKIAELFPQVVTEALDTVQSTQEKKVYKKVINFEMLKQVLTSDALSGDEAYELTWVGKKQAMAEVGRPIRKTLRPVKADSENWDTTKNIYIEGDNLEALKLLHESYRNKVKMIYIDPPYNTGKDFVYRDNFTRGKDEYDEESGAIDSETGERLLPNPESNGRFHSDWCSMMYPRLMIARNLLAQEGVIFISIDDNEQTNLKKICDEVFGASNFIGCAGRITKKSNNKGDFWAPNFDYVLTYAKNRNMTDPFLGGVNEASYSLIEEDGPRKGERYQLVRLYMSTIENRNPEQRFWIDCPDGSKIIPPGSTFPPERPVLGDGIWRWSRKKFEAERERIVVKQVKSSNLLDENRNPAKWNVFTKTYLKDVIDGSTAKPNNFIEGFINQMASHELNDLEIPFDYAKPTELIKFLIDICKVKDNEIVLDFFSGSASTAHAVLKANSGGANKKFIMVQLPEQIDEKNEEYKFLHSINKPTNICEIGKERIRRAGKKIAEENQMTAPNLDTGFRVFRIDDTNMKDVYYSAGDYTQNLLDQMESNIKDGRTDLDLLYSCLVEWGLTLDLPHKSEKIDGVTVHTVNEGDLIACFDENVPESVVREIANRKPLRAVFRDSSFASSPAKINVCEIFKLLAPNAKVKVL